MSARVAGVERSVREPSGSRGRTVGVLALVLLVAGCGEEQPGREPKPAQEAVLVCPKVESRPAGTGSLPDVTLGCLGEGPDTRLADLRGPMVVNVWAQWCPPCRQEAPYLAELHRRGKVKVLGIDYADPRPELARKFAQDNDLDYPHLVDQEKALRLPLKIGGPPVTAFVDADGKVVYVHRGVFTSQRQLDQLVADKLGVTG